MSNIVTWPDPRLEQVCEPVPHGERCRELVEALFAELERHPTGVGLAAPQLGVMKRVIVVRVPIVHFQTRGLVKHHIINPVIVWHNPRDKMVEAWEGCLSFPDKQVSIPRWRHIKVQGFNLRWEPIEIGAKNLVARVIQHEVDHLDGRTLAHYARIAHEVEQERRKAEEQLSFNFSQQEQQP